MLYSEFCGWLRQARKEVEKNKDSRNPRGHGIKLGSNNAEWLEKARQERDREL